MKSMAYLLGRKAAPLFLKADWIMKSLTGSESQRIAAEYQLGCLLAQVYEGQVPAFENNRLADIAHRLVAVLTNKERTFGFKLDRSGAVNALALPGGFIYCSESLFDLCGEDVDAIAFVLAHEIAHGIHGDANKRFLTKAAIGGLLRMRTHGIGQPVRQLLGHLAQQGYSREQEFRADRFAVALTKAAGFDPRGGCRLFALLGNDAPGAAGLGAFLSSHPPLADRTERIAARIRELEK